MSRSLRPSDRLQALRERVSSLTQTVEVLKEKARRGREAAKREARKREIVIYLDNFFIPYLEGIAERYGETLEDGVRRLIRKKTYKYPVRYRRNEAVMDLRKFLAQPQIQVVLTKAAPFIRWKMNQISQGLDFVLDQVLSEEYPYLYDAIASEEGGREWFKTTVQDMIKLLRHLMRV